MSTRRAVSAALLALITLACTSEAPAPPPAPDSGPSEWAGTIEESNGVVRVRNPAAGLWDDAATPPLRFEPVATYGGRGTQITGIGGVVVDRDGNVHIYDPIGGALIELSPDGAVVQRAGSSGSGPEGLAAVRGIAYDGHDAIWLANQNGTRLDAWSIDGEHLRTIPVADLGLNAVYMGGFLSPDHLAVISDAIHPMAMNDYIVLELVEPARIVDRFSIEAEPMVPIPEGVVLQLSNYFHDGHVFVGTWEQYLLREFDATGNLVRRVTRPVDYLRRPGFALLDRQYLGVALGGLAAPLVLDSGHWLVLATWPTNVDSPNTFAETPPDQRPTIEWATSLDLFDPEGRFLYSLQYPGAQAPDIGRPWTIGPGGDLYTVAADPFPEVRRYRVVLEPPPSGTR